MVSYNTVAAAAIMAGSIRDARHQERERIVQLLLAHGQNTAALIILEDSK